MIGIFKYIGRSVKNVLKDRFDQLRGVELLLASEIAAKLDKYGIPIEKVNDVLGDHKFPVGGFEFVRGLKIETRDDGRTHVCGELIQDDAEAKRTVYNIEYEIQDNRISYSYARRSFSSTSKGLLESKTELSNRLNKSTKKPVDSKEDLPISRFKVDLSKLEKIGNNSLYNLGKGTGPKYCSKYSDNW